MSGQTENYGTVLLVANYKPDVGFAWWLMENFWVQFADVARERGFKPLLAYPEDGAVPEAIKKAGIEIVIIPFPGRGLSQLKCSLELVRQHRIRCIYFTDRPFNSLVYLLFRLVGVRLIINHDHTPGDRPAIRGLKGSAKSLWRRWSMASCDLQLCVAPVIRERAIANARIPPEKAVVVQNGIVPIECSGDRHYAHHKFCLPLDARICINVGRASPYKRIDFVIEVARHCIHELGVKNLVFVHVGDGPDMERLQARAMAANLGDSFVFAGRRTDVHQLLCSSDYALHPAKGEAFSLAIVEYMSAGLAVIVPDIPTVCQAIDDGRTGVVFPDGNVLEAAQLLGTLAQDSGWRNHLGVEAAEEVRKNFDLKKMNESFKREIRQAWDQRFV